MLELIQIKFFTVHIQVDSFTEIFFISWLRPFVSPLFHPCLLLSTVATNCAHCAMAILRLPIETKMKIEISIKFDFFHIACYH